MMGAAANGCCDGSAARMPAALCLQFAAEPLQVRAALCRTIDTLRNSGLSSDCCGTAEIVLAEVLNNIAEHGYAGLPPGWVELQLDLSHSVPRFTIRDGGRRIPEGALPMADCESGPAPELLPEGGFGRFLIAQIARDLCYCRCDGINHLRFSLF